MTMMGIDKTRKTTTSTSRRNNFTNLRSTGRWTQRPIAKKLLTRPFSIFASNKGEGSTLSNKRRKTVQHRRKAQNGRETQTIRRRRN
jgi:hypothetical protein